MGGGSERQGGGLRMGGGSKGGRNERRGIKGSASLSSTGQKGAPIFVPGRVRTITHPSKPSKPSYVRPDPPPSPPECRNNSVICVDATPRPSDPSDPSDTPPQPHALLAWWHGIWLVGHAGPPQLLACGIVPRR
jgi:hypothetical protein